MPRLTACGTDAIAPGAAYSPANCSRGCLPSSIPRSLASSRGNVIPRHRHDPLAPGELDLEIHQVLLPERHFRRRQVKFPHAGKTLVIEAHRLFAPRHEAVAPGLQRFSIMQPQDFDVADQKARLLDRGDDLGKGGDIAAREDVFRDPWARHIGAGRAADRVQHHDAVVAEKFGAAPEKGFIEVDADMFEHADRHDAVEWAGNIAVIARAGILPTPSGSFRRRGHSRPAIAPTTA